MSLNPALPATVHGLVLQAQNRAARSVDAERVLLYWHIGRVIREEEQHGADQATHGTSLIKGLAEALQLQCGGGFSGQQLHWYVQFHRTFPNVTILRSQFTWTRHPLVGIF